ncbi:MAG TPA: ATP-grasp domain-containing protein [Gaiellaceae bacterium]
MHDGVRSIFAERRFEHRRPAAVWIVSGRSNATNELLVGALHERGVRAGLARPANLSDLARDDDTVLGRLDVRPTLNGVEDGLWELHRIEGRGTRILNPAPSLLACHDKLQTAIRLARFGVAHPSTRHVDERGPDGGFAFPVVVKPRFGSWGRDIVLCKSERQLRRCLRRLRKRAWFREQGALVQELVPPQGFDLRLLVACGEVVGAIKRVAAKGEWRTNIALGGSRTPAVPTADAVALARAAATAVGGDLVGVDLLPLPYGGYVVVEVNGAVDFTPDYSLGSEDVFEAVVRRLVATPADVADASEGLAAPS